jgi:hypothetical protein
MCGSKMADATFPYHKECEASYRMKAAAATADFSGLSKTLSVSAEALTKVSKILDSIEGKFASRDTKISALEKRMKTLEEQPAAGGPMRTELPEGVRPVEKSGSEKQEQGEAMLKAVMEMQADPFVKDQLSRQLAKMDIKRRLSGVM